MTGHDGWIARIPRAKHYNRVVRQRLQRILVEDGYPRIFHKVLQQIVAKPGKLLRPMLTLYAAEATGRPYSSLALDAAVAVELVHVSSLILDDIIDESPTRRGLASIHTRYGNGVAVLSAGVLLLRGLADTRRGRRRPIWRQAVRTRSLAEVKRIRAIAFDSARDLSLGQAIEMHGKIRTTDDYLHMIELKTATLFKAAMAMGAVAGGLRPDTMKRLTEYGRNLGMAFQVRDDMLDLLGTAEAVGKPVGADLRSGKTTIVSIELCRILRTTRPRLAAYDLDALRQIARRSGLIDTAQRLADTYTRRAMASVQTMHNTTAKRALLQLAAMAAGRRS